MNVSVGEMKRRIYKLTVKDSNGNVEYYSSTYEYAMKTGVDIRNLRTANVKEAMEIGDSTQPFPHKEFVYVFTRTK
ncbi:hypothetical protein J5069_02980 [Candidatus Symbiopectobacterium sp. NZEC127]|uniref:hypothetical protein n=1 Tax=Candidatus Symbiopectobacterium sp. NZEC127 TaxID=2820472 RepID=UPI0022279729|nr:hypothetical protein [Candidatus Symbiopectobacterium sp. NZEC127]MCW2484855.1 hypothetical protein [Candidatus Symbiopectobacterium sp. NZEC127]